MAIAISLNYHRLRLRVGSSGTVLSSSTPSPIVPSALDTTRTTTLVYLRVFIAQRGDRGGAGGDRSSNYGGKLRRKSIQDSLKEQSEWAGLKWGGYTWARWRMTVSLSGIHMYRQAVFTPVRGSMYGCAHASFR